MSFLNYKRKNNHQNSNSRPHHQKRSGSSSMKRDNSSSSRNSDKVYRSSMNISPDQLFNSRGLNFYSLAESEREFIKRANQLLMNQDQLSDNASSRQAFQMHYAHTVFNQLVSCDANERLLMMNYPPALEPMDRLVFWSDSDLFYGFLHSIVEKNWIQLASGQTSQEIMGKILFQLRTDTESGNPELAEKAFAAIKEIADSFLNYEPLLYSRNARNTFLNFIETQIEMQAYDTLSQHLKLYRDFIMEQKEWFLDPDNRFFGVLLLAFLKSLQKKLHNRWSDAPQSLIESYQNLWNTFFHFPVEIDGMPSSHTSKKYKFKCSEEDAKFFLDMCCNRESALVIQLFFESTSQRVLHAIYKKIFKGKLVKLSQVDDGKFVIAAFLDALRVEKDFTSVYNELMKMEVAQEHPLLFMWDNQLKNIVVSLVEGCHRFNFQQEKVLKECIAYSRRSDDEKQRTSNDSGTLLSFLNKTVFSYRSSREKFDRFGVKLLVALLQFDCPSLKVLVSDFAKLNSEDILDLATDKWGSVVLDHWIKCLFSNKKQIQDKTREKVLSQFRGLCVRLVTNVYGSFVISTILDHAPACSTINASSYRFIPEEILSNEEQCRGSKFARIFFKKYNLHQYKIDSNSWVSQTEKSKKVVDMFADLLGESPSVTADAVESAVEIDDAEQKQEKMKKRKEKAGDGSSSGSDSSSSSDSSSESDSEEDENSGNQVEKKPSVVSPTAVPQKEASSASSDTSDSDSSSSSSSDSSSSSSDSDSSDTSNSADNSSKKRKRAANGLKKSSKRRRKV